MTSEICEFRWLHLPYRDVRRAMLDDPAGLIRAAASDAVRHSSELLATLDVDIAGVHIERRVRLTLGQVIDIGAPLPILKLPMRWLASSRPDLYPIMDGTLEAYPISGDRTQLSMQGRYRPPFGRIGAALDAIALHNVAEAAVEHFLERVADAVEAAISGPEPPERPRPLIEPEGPAR